MMLCGSLFQSPKNLTTRNQLRNYSFTPMDAMCCHNLRSSKMYNLHDKLKIMKKIVNVMLIDCHIVNFYVVQNTSSVNGETRI